MYLSFRIGGPPLYGVTDWTVVESEDGRRRRLVYRPGPRTILRRLIASAVSVIMIVVMVVLFGMPPGSRWAGRRKSTIPRQDGQVRQIQEATEKLREDLRRSLPAEKWEGLEEKLRQQQAERQRRRAADEKRLRTWSLVGRSSYWTVFAVLAAVAILAPATAPWQRIVIEGSPRDGLAVTKTILWPRTRVVKAGDVVALTVNACEWWHRGRHHLTFLGWRWEVRVHYVDRDRDKAAHLEFWPDMEPTLPPHIEDLTPRVRQLLDALQWITGRPASPPTVRHSHHRRRYADRMGPPSPTSAS